MLYQEVALWDAKRTKEKTKYVSGPQGIAAMIQLIDKQVLAELKRQPAKHTSRAKRELDLAKQMNLIEDFRLEQAGLAMLYHDGDSSKRRFHEIRTFQLGMTTHLTVPREMASSTLLNKVEQRLTGYTRSLVRALHERQEKTTKTGNERGKRLWRLSESIAKVVGGQSFNEPVVWPQSADLVEILTTLELIEHQSAALRSVRQSATAGGSISSQASLRNTIPPGGGSISLAGSVETENNEAFLQGLDRISESYNILTKILMLLSDWPDEDEMDVVIIQWFRAFRATLSSEYMNMVDTFSSAEEEQEKEVGESVHEARSDASKVTSITVATELAWWIRAMCNGKRNELNPAAAVNQEDAEALQSQWYKKQERQKNIKWNTKNKPQEEEALPSLRQEGDGFYLAVFSTYPDVFFAARSVFMQLLQAVSQRKAVLEHRNRLKAHMETIQSTATSRAEIEQERREKAAAEAERLADVAFIESASGALRTLTHAALDLCQLVMTPLEDVFCSVRKLGVGDFRYIETGERCVTEALRLMCAVFVGCSSERPHGIVLPPPPALPDVPQPQTASSRRNKEPPREQSKLTDEAVIGAAQIFSSDESGPLLIRCYRLFKSCSKICIECVDNIPMQSALLQAVNTVTLYLLQADARLLHRRKVAADELSKLKPVEQVLTDIFGAGPAVAVTADPNVETEQQRWDRLTAASKQPHRGVDSNLIGSMVEVVPALLTCMSRHKEIPSLQYYGFLNLRLLFRMPFFKPNQLEELLAESGGGGGEMGAPGGLDGLGGGTMSQSISGGPSMLDLDGSLSMLSISEWRGANVQEAGAVYTREQHRENCRDKLAAVLAYTGESHASKLEVLEQYLLFLILVSKTSLECQGILQAIKIDLLMQRIAILQHQSPYFTALCEIFEENMREVEAAMR